jgi:hypothetical protein
MGWILMPWLAGLGLMAERIRVVISVEVCQFQRTSRIKELYSTPNIKGFLLGQKELAAS